MLFWSYCSQIKWFRWNAKIYYLELFMRLENKNIFLPLVYMAKWYSYSPNVYIKWANFDIQHDPFEPIQINSMKSAVLKYIHCMEISEYFMMKRVNLDHMISYVGRKFIFELCCIGKWEMSYAWTNFGKNSLMNIAKDLWKCSENV